MNVARRAIAYWLLANSLVGGFCPGLSATASPRSDQPASECATCSQAPPVFVKLGRGVANTVGGWLEIPLTIHRQYTERDTAGSMAAGAVFGLVKGVVRTGVGLYEIVTFLLPIPPQYAPILPTLGYYDRLEETRRPLPLE